LTGGGIGKLQDMEKKTQKMQEFGYPEIGVAPNTPGTREVNWVNIEVK